MGKKKTKKRDASSLSNSSIQDQSVMSNSLQSESSFIIGEGSPQFKVMLVENMEDKDNYLKWTKSVSWKNKAFIHPSVLCALNCCTYVLIQGKVNFSIYITYPLRSVKKSTVVLSHDVDFSSEELVTIHPFEGHGFEAEEISVVPPSLFQINHRITDMLWKKLCNRFIWPGLKVQIKLFDSPIEFTVKKVQSSGHILHKNIWKLSEDTSQSPDSSMSLNASVENSELQLSSKLSSLNICDDLDYDSSLTTNAEASKCVIPNFFVLSHRTSIVWDTDPSQKDSLKFPLFNDVGGYQEKIQVMKNYVAEFLKKVAENDQTCSHFLLLRGPLGIGKTMMLSAICNEYNINSEVINLLHLCCLRKNLSVALEEITQKIKNAVKNSPSFLLLSEFDFLCSEPSETYSSFLSTVINRIASCKSKVLVLASLNSDSNFDEKLLQSFRVKEINFALPTTLEKEEIFKKVLLQTKHQLSDEQIKLCAEVSQGTTGGEIFKIVKYDALLLSVIRMKNKLGFYDNSMNPDLIFRDIETALKKKRMYVPSKKVKWSDIGGMEAVKEKLKEEIELSKADPEVLKRFNYSPSRGILLYGPPGCSKTMIAKALATECNWNFISKQLSDILNMYVGESEKAVKNIFLEAREKAPCIIFLDEIDALASERSSSSSASGVGNRIVNTLLTEMAGIETLKDIMVIAATNRPGIVDQALLRRGRIGHHIYVPLPDCRTRKEIFKIAMKQRQVADEVDFDYLVQKTEGYSGAEIVLLCNEAAYQILLGDPLCSSAVFHMKHFELALLAVLPRTSKEAIQCYEQFSLK